MSTNINSLINFYKNESNRKNKVINKNERYKLPKIKGLCRKNSQEHSSFYQVLSDDDGISQIHFLYDVYIIMIALGKSISHYFLHDADLKKIILPLDWLPLKATL